MNRQQALEWCVENVSEWAISPNFECWYWWSSPLGDIELNSTCSAETPITKQDWLEAKAKKESEPLVWFSIGGPRLKQFGAVFYVHKEKDMIDWDNAPEGATHFRPDSIVKWYKVSEIDGCTSVSFSLVGTKWEHSASYEKGEFSKSELIPRPPSQTYTPQVGEECEYYCSEGAEYRKGLVYCTYKQGFIVIDSEDETPAICYAHNLRPLKTERDKFIETATSKYMKRIGSDAINQKWFGRVFGAMYDEGSRFND